MNNIEMVDNQDIIQRCDEILEAYKPKPKPKKQAPLIELNKKIERNEIKTSKENGYCLW